MHDQINKLVADAFRTHAAPLPDYAKPKGDIGRGFGTRFAGGWTEVTARPCGDEDIYRPGSYCTYAHRTTMIPLLPGARSITYWSPAVFFLPDDPALKPELAFDGDPFRRQARVVPLSSGGSAKAIKRRVFAHLENPLERLRAFHAATGQRWEVIVERERRRCAETGEPFGMPELPLDPQSLS